MGRRPYLAAKSKKANRRAKAISKRQEEAVAEKSALLKHIERDAGKTVHALVPTDSGLRGERLYSMQYLVFDNAFALPLKNGYCRIAY